MPYRCHTGVSTSRRTNSLWRKGDSGRCRKWSMKTVRGRFIGHRSLLITRCRGVAGRGDALKESCAEGDSALQLHEARPRLGESKLGRCDAIPLTSLITIRTPEPSSNPTPSSGESGELPYCACSPRVRRRCHLVIPHRAIVPLRSLHRRRLGPCCASAAAQPFRLSAGEPIQANDRSRRAP